MNAATVQQGAADSLAVRSCLSRFATGIAVAAVDGPEGWAGLTVNSFTAVSHGDGLGYFNSRFAKLEEPVLGMEYIFG